MPVIIHEVSEVSDNLVNKNLFNKFMNDRMVVFAADVLRAEILLQRGGFYMDIGLEQKEDLEPYFRQYEVVLIMDRCYGSAKGSSFLTQTTALLKAIPGIAKSLVVLPEALTVHRYFAYHSWEIVLARGSIEKSKLLVADFDRYFRYHGLQSWYEYINNLSFDYFPASVE